MSIVMIGVGAALLATTVTVNGPTKEELEAAAAAAAEATAEKRGDNAYVCKKFPPPTGTRLGRKRQICMTQEQWDSYNDDVEYTMDQFDYQSNIDARRD